MPLQKNSALDDPPAPSDKRVSELLPSLDPSLDLAIKVEAEGYVCLDCGRADPDPFMGLLDDRIVFYCPNCRRQSLD